jgi:hypothetical protein
MIKDLILLLEDLEIDYAYNKKLSTVDFYLEGAIHSVSFEGEGIILLDGNYVSYRDLIYTLF